MGKYKSFTKWNIPQNFNYDTRDLEKNGYKIKGQFNKTNLDFIQYCEDLESERKNLKIIETGNNIVHLWVKKIYKNSQNLARS